MSYSKKLTINYYFINTVAESYYRDLENTLEKMYKGNEVLQYNTGSNYYLGKIISRCISKIFK